MKLLFWSLVFLTRLLSHGNCATVDVMNSPGFPTDDYSEGLRNAISISQFMKTELEKAHSTLGEEAYQEALLIIKNIPKSKIDELLLKAIFDAIKLGAKSKAIQKDSKLLRLEKFVEVFESNSSPKWGFRELETHIPQFRTRIDALNLGTLDDYSWDTIVKNITEKIKKEKENIDKFNIAIAAINEGITIIRHFTALY